MSQKIFNIRFALTGIIIILSYYFYVIFLKLDPNNNLSISINKNFFLSLGILTDLTYLDLLMREKLPIINSNYNFLYIFYSIDRSLIKIFGLESFWIFNIFYKLISFLILYFGFNKLFNFKKENLIIFSICLAIFFCIDIQPFNDRWPRPQLTNIFAFFVIVNNLKYLNNIEVSNFSNFFYGLSHAITAFTVPWFSAIILSLSAFTFFLKNKNKAKLFIILGFLIIFLPNIIIYFVNSINSSHSEYLGIKLIYDRINFIEDFYFTIILKKQFLILILFQILVSFIIKKYDEIKIITYSLIVSPLPFVLIGSSIQSYHLVLIFLEFQIIICIWHFFSIFKFLELKDKVLQIRSLGISSIIFSLVLLFFLGNSWGERIKEYEKNWSDNKNIFSYLDDKSSSCILVTNNRILQVYWINFIKGGILPNDGFMTFQTINKTLEEVKLTLKLLSKIQNLEKSEIDRIIKISTHNYFAATRSTIAKSLAFKDQSEKEEFIYSRKDIDSMDPWMLSLPDSIYENILTYENIDISELNMNRYILIYKNINNENFLIEDYCENN